MKLLSLFSGIGAFEKALNNLKVPYELVAYCEIDKYASKSYSSIHDVPESMNLGDITKIDEKALPKDIDLITYGFPCQDISLAGKQKGLFNEDGTQTRSGLYFEALRIIEETQPRVAIAENVKNLISKKFSEQFKIVLDSLDAAGYNNYWMVLNAKDYGIPQNRERVFIVSIRKDIDTGMFQFPEGFPLELRLKDMLEDEVDEKFYISNKMTEYLINTKFNQDSDTIQNGDVCKCLRAGGTTPCVEEQNQTTKYGRISYDRGFEDTGDIASALCARDYKGMGRYKAINAVCEVTEPVRLGNIYGENCGTGFAGNVWDKEAISPTLMTMQGGNRQPMVVVNVGNVNPSGKGQNGQVIDSEGLARTITQEKGEGQKILVRTNNSKGYDIAEPGDYINIERPTSTTRSGRVGHGVSQCLDTKENHCVVTAEPFIARSVGRNPENPSDRTPGIPTEQRLEPNSQGICNTLTTVQKDNYVVEPSQLRIRKLTPKECFRLMGFDDADYEKAANVNSNTQLYKQAGNSIVVDVVEHIINALLDCGVLKTEKEKEMELKVKTPTFPEVIEFNFQELKQEITERASTYVNLVYTEEQIQDAKKDRATLNKFVKALSDERIKIKKECLKPYEDFEKKIRELDGIVNKAIQNIDSQVKGYEEKQKQDKLDEIKNFWNSCTPPFPIKFEQIFDSKWLNASVSMKSIQTEMGELLARVESDLATLENLPEFGFEATEVYKTTLDLGKAIQEGQRLSDIAKRKAAYEAEQARIAAEVTTHPTSQIGQAIESIERQAFENCMNPPVEEAPVKQWISFSALLSTEDALALKAFFKSRNIEFKAV